MNKNFTMTVVKDPHHLVSRKIRNDYKEVDILKANSICNISDENHSDKLFMLGDVFNDLDNYSISVNRLEKAKDILEIYINRGYRPSTILGNHDMINRKEDSTFLNTYLKSHIDLIEESEIIFENEDVIIILHPVHYKHDVNEIVKRMMQIDEDIKMIYKSEERKVVNLVAVHWNVLFENDPLSNIENLEFMTPQKIKEYIPNLDILILGHIHHSNKSLNWVCNPNTPIRNNNNEINNTPECAVIDFYIDGTFEIKYFELEHKPSTIVFNQDYLKLISEELNGNLFNFDIDKFSNDILGSMQNNISKLITTIEDNKLRLKTQILVKKYLNIKD